MIEDLEKELAGWLRGHCEAIAFVQQVFAVFETWDDLVDQDSPCSADDINTAFYRAFVSIPRNEFYQTHFGLLNPLIETAILDWLASNKMEATKNIEALRQSYVLRCTAQQLIVMCARIIGGPVWATEVNVAVRMSGDTFKDYSEKLGA